MASTTVSTVPTAALVDWDDKQMQMQIKETYGKNLLPAEWNLFMGLGKATKLNPFLREIWAVKYGSNPASVFVGRDGYRRSAQAHPEYEYHYAMAVHANDVFSMKNGETEHEPNLKDPGAIVGAYCVVKRKSSERPVTTFVKFGEYKQAHGVWSTKPATMITKVAEAQGLRASFQELFAGTYEESEDWEKPKDLGTHTMVVGDDKKDPLAPTPEQTNIVDEVQKVETPAPAPRAKRGRPAKTAAPAQDAPAEIIDAEVVQPAPVAATPLKEVFKNSPKVPEDAIPVGKIRIDQTKKLFAVWGEYKKVVKMDEAKSTTERKKLMKDMFDTDTSVSLNEHQADELIERIEGLTEMARDVAGADDVAQANGDGF